MADQSRIMSVRQDISTLSETARQSWIRQCEKEFYDNFYGIADEIEDKRQLRIVRLFGPTCSGKTTAARILISMFADLKKRAHVVSIDDFYYSKKTLDAQCGGAIDYDSPDTIDMKALELFVRELFESETVHCPIFDFTKDMRTGYREITVKKDDIFIFEGIQAIYPQVIEALGTHGSASIYIAPMRPLEQSGELFEPNEIRLLRRLVRDYKFRATNPEFTLMLWESVRENEEKNIFPYVKNSDFFVNSTMEYELCILKPYLEPLLANIGRESRYRECAQSLLQRIAAIPSLSDRYIEDEMLYREFV